MIPTETDNRKTPPEAQLREITCIVCGNVYLARSPRAAYCPGCRLERIRQQSAEYRRARRKPYKDRLEPNQAAIVDELICAGELSNRRIAEHVASLGIAISKEGVGSRRKRLGLTAYGPDIEPPLVLIEAQNIFEATEHTGQGRTVDYRPPNEATPTTAAPGTRAKLAVLAARAQAGMPLWHQGDNLTYEPTSGGSTSDEVEPTPID